MNLPLFEQLGVKEAIDRIGMPKYGIEFVSPWHENTTMLDFAQSWHKSLFYSYEVRRSEFDHVLLRNAAAKGACVIEGCRIAQVEFPPDGSVVATGQDGDGRARQFAARFLVDASGRDTLLAGRLAIKQRNRRHASAAVFGHFTGARRLPGKAAGNISIFWFEHGWFWFIPLVDGTTSVGAVCPPEFIKSRGTDVSSFLASLIAQCPALAERLADAQMTGPATATGNYSYRAGRMSGNNFIMLGDAYAFIDPVFSTGVYIAMKSAFLGADVVTAFLHRPGAEADRALRHFETRDARRTRQIFLVHLSRQYSGNARPVHGASQLFSDAGGIAVAAIRRRVRSFADSLQVAAFQSCVPYQELLHAASTIVGSMVGNAFPRSMNFVRSSNPATAISGGSVNTARPPRRHDHPLGAGTQLQYRRETISHCRGHPSTGMAGLGGHRRQHRRDRRETCLHGHE